MGDLSVVLVVAATHEAVAQGGVAMSVLAYASVCAEGRTFAHQLVVDGDLRPFLRQFATALHGHGSAACVQLTHSGAFADAGVTGVRAKGPSAVFNPATFGYPAVMTADDMAEVAAAFVRAAIACKECGIDAVELHCGHGYLLSQVCACRLFFFFFERLGLSLCHAV
jgi:2,4-dienoyl-CoA reductase-like NADH-dependent reductase (Old Yellow Enzyme family)